MEHLWSPWRSKYVSQADPRDECIFCVKQASTEDEKNLILYRGRAAFVLLNLYPYTNGHLMIAPYRHIATLDEADDELLVEMSRLTRDAERHLRAVYRAPGYNIGMNIGACAGAGVAGHIHTHVLPRWPGDVNFMTSVADTRVLPEDLRTTYDKLARAFHSGNHT
jgi:ATP adenylyltransferase